MKRAPIYLIAAALVASPATISSGFAQTNPQQRQQQLGSFDDQDLRTYAEASLQIQAINEKYLPRMQAAGSPQDQLAIRNEAQGKMVEAIREKGLTIEQYNQISDAARADPKTAEKINRFRR
jgi:hypothetical protein